MKRLIRMLRRVRVKFVHSSRRTKMVVLGMVAVCMVALLTLNLSSKAFQKKTEEDRKKAAQLEYENSQKQEDIDNFGSAEGIEDLAQDELGMVPTDAVVIKPTTPQQ